MVKVVYDCATNMVTEYFKPGRDDAAKGNDNKQEFWCTGELD